MLSFLFLSEKKKEKSLSLSPACSEADNALSTGILIMHGKEKPAQLSALPVFMELLTSILRESLQFNLTRTTSPALIRCISKKCFRSARREWRRRRQIERMSLRKTEMNRQRQGKKFWKRERQMERKTESQAEAVRETDTERDEHYLNGWRLDPVDKF